VAGRQSHSSPREAGIVDTFAVHKGFGITFDSDQSAADRRSHQECTVLADAGHFVLGNFADTRGARPRSANRIGVA
jgi:hypothetical protein